MYIPDLETHECRTLAEASELLERHAPSVRLLAGGTDVLVDLKSGRVSVQHLVSIRGIAALRGVRLDEDGLRIGALTTVTELTRWLEHEGANGAVGRPADGREPGCEIEQNHTVQRFAAILEATRGMAAPQVRNLATVGGNIASAVPCADLPPILIALRAELCLWSAREPRRVPLSDFFIGPRRTILRSDEIVEAIVVPTPAARSGAAYERFALRDGNAIAVAAVAAGVRLDAAGVIADARIVLGAVAPIPKCAAAAAEFLLGRRADASAFEEAGCLARAESAPISDVRGSAQYRRELVAVLTCRALSRARARAEYRWHERPEAGN